MIKQTKKNNEKAFTLLEYCAGAAMMIAILVAVMTQFSTGLTDLANGVSKWSKAQGDAIGNSPGITVPTN